MLVNIKALIIQYTIILMVIDWNKIVSTCYLEGYTFVKKIGWLASVPPRLPHHNPGLKDSNEFKQILEKIFHSYNKNLIPSHIA